MTSIFGFALLRNGLKYDYPFLESLESLSAIAQETVLALGNSEDGTEDKLHAIPNLHTIHTTWDESLREDGRILSQQTNLALTELRSRQANGWGFYLQSDEVLLETEIAKIKEDLAHAEKTGCDAVSFRYLHFWQRFDRIAIGSRWYPQEIRAIRLDKKIESYGDAQSFHGYKKVYQSDAHIFHYGHVRKEDAYEQKKRDFHRWWHSDNEIKNILKKSAVSDRAEETLAYFGPHPKVMAARLKNLPGSFGEKKDIWIYGPKLLEASHLHFSENLEEVLQHPPESTALLSQLPTLKRLFHWRYRSRVPLGMRSPQARPWQAEFRLKLLLAEKGVSL